MHLIRDTISAAKAVEADHRNLHKFLAAKVPQLHHTIALPADSATEVMEKFVTDYIDHVPDFLEAFTELTKAAGVYDHAQKFLTIAEDYFLAPPEIVDAKVGLKSLIDEAYLAHRLIEEINDRMMIACGIPLSPMDMTLSNIIVHTLLSDEFANQLDMAVLYAMESLFESDNFYKNTDFKDYLRKNHENGWKQAIANWPCLAGDSAIALNLDFGRADARIH